MTPTWKGQPLADFIATATGPQLREYVAHMRQVYARVMEDITASPSAPVPDADDTPAERDFTGARFRARRKALNLSQRYVAGQLGTWRGTLDRIEHDRSGEGKYLLLRGLLDEFYREKETA